jgi:antitoxin HicB
MRPYTIVLTPDQEEGGDSIQSPSLPGLHTQGDTYEQSVANARAAIAFHLECQEAESETLPEASAPLRLATIDV